MKAGLGGREANRPAAAIFICKYYCKNIKKQIIHLNAKNLLEKGSGQ